MELDLGHRLSLCLPRLNDLIFTKRFGARPKDAEDIRMLQALRAEGARSFRAVSGMQNPGMICARRSPCREQQIPNIR